MLLSPEQIDHVSWEEREVYVRMTREAVRNAPEYDPANPAQALGLARGLGGAPTP